MNRKLASLFLYLGVSFGPAQSVGAAVTPAGTAKDVVRCPTCAERVPAIAGTGAGQVLAGWEGSTATDPRGLLARLFVSPGQPRGVQFSLNTATQFLQERNLALSGTPAGGFVAAFETIDSAGDSDVWVRRFDASGKPLAADAQVNIEDLALGTSDSLPALDVGPDGSFLVAWVANPKPPGPFDRVPVIMARRFNASGAPLQLPVVVSTSLIDARPPSACIDSTGRGVVSWITADEIRIFQPSKNGVAYRRFGSTGLPLDTTEKTVARPLAQQSDVAVSCGLGGSFVVAWSTDQAPVAPGSGVVGARYDQRGRRLGAMFLVGAEAQHPAISHDTLGNFVVVWNSQQAATSAVAGRRYLANGSADGAAFPVAQSPLLSASLRTAKVAHFGTTKAFAVAWDSGQQNVFLRFFKAQ